MGDTQSEMKRNQSLRVEAPNPAEVKAASVAQRTLPACLTVVPTDGHHHPRN